MQLALEQAVAFWAQPTVEHAQFGPGVLPLGDAVHQQLTGAFGQFAYLREIFLPDLEKAFALAMPDVPSEAHMFDSTYVHPRMRLFAACSLHSFLPPVAVVAIREGTAEYVFVTNEGKSGRWRGWPQVTYDARILRTQKLLGKAWGHKSPLVQLALNEWAMDARGRIVLGEGAPVVPRNAQAAARGVRVWEPSGTEFQSFYKLWYENPAKKRV